MEILYQVAAKDLLQQIAVVENQVDNEMEEDRQAGAFYGLCRNVFD